jgi:hypothetical protein
MSEVTSSFQYITNVYEEPADHLVLFREDAASGGVWTLYHSEPMTKTQST